MRDVGHRQRPLSELEYAIDDVSAIHHQVRLQVDQDRERLPTSLHPALDYTQSKFSEFVGLLRPHLVDFLLDASLYDTPMVCGLWLPSCQPWRSSTMSFECSPRAG